MGKASTKFVLQFIFIFLISMKGISVYFKYGTVQLILFLIITVISYIALEGLGLDKYSNEFKLICWSNRLWWMEILSMTILLMIALGYITSTTMITNAIISSMNIMGIMIIILLLIRIHCDFSKLDKEKENLSDEFKDSDYSKMNNTIDRYGVMSQEGNISLIKEAIKANNNQLNDSIERACKNVSNAIISEYNEIVECERLDREKTVDSILDEIYIRDEYKVEEYSSEDIERILSSIFADD